MKKVFESFYDFLIHEVSQNNTLYHRSPIKLKIGTKIKPKKIKGKHWLSNEISEIALEELRKTKYSDKPSRFESIYASVTPRSRFVDKGYLYVIKPIGKVFMTNSTYIDEINKEFNDIFYSLSSDYMDELIADVKNKKEFALNEIMSFLPYEADLYWQGVNKGDILDLEVLCENAIVTEEIIDNRLKKGQTVTVIKNNFNVQLDLYFNSIKSKKKFTDNEINLFITNLKNNLFADITNIDKNINSKSKKYNNIHIGINGYLKKNTKLMVTQVNSGLKGGSKNKIDTKYINLRFDFYLNKKLYKRKNQAPLFLLSTSNYLNNDSYDISKWLKINK